MDKSHTSYNMDQNGDPLEDREAESNEAEEASLTQALIAKETKSNTLRPAEAPQSRNILTMENPHPLFTRLSAALFYGVASFMIMVVNKNVLTTQQFPSFQFLGLGQMVATILVLFIGRLLKIVSFPSFSPDIFRKIWPLPLFYIGNMLFGLGGTKELSLPMMTVLRRFSILMTMMGEYYILNSRPRLAVQLSVYMMILGAMVAACNDLAFNMKGYIFILLNDICTAAQGVYMKKKLESKELGKYGLMFYNSIFMIIPALLISFNMGEFEKVANFPKWDDAFFVTMFLLSSIFGFILIFATVCCTQYNSALTTSIVGCLKNVLITNGDWWRLHFLVVELHGVEHQCHRKFGLHQSHFFIHEVRAEEANQHCVSLPYQRNPMVPTIVMAIQRQWRLFDFLVGQLGFQNGDLLLEIRRDRVQFLLVADHHPLHFIQLLIPWITLLMDCPSGKAQITVQGWKPWHGRCGFERPIQNFRSSCRLSRVLLERSSVTSMLAFFKVLDCLRTVSRSLKVSKATKTGRHPLTSGPGNQTFYSLCRTSELTRVHTAGTLNWDLPADVQMIPEKIGKVEFEAVRVLMGATLHPVEDQ
eukprot:maker-scaffold1166_size57906-snap-gene-0.7 protein:Tk05908 transcript:maker-scaffold1166_size57906-snap-gene-0.7-mRNA-1 annotation:"hypothetical protein TcasGA2_TC003250"